MAVYKLSYFNIRARAECSRLLFAVAGQEYQDDRIEFKDWPTIKPTMPLGQLPVLNINGNMIPQSRAIERHLAREFGLYGKNNMEATMCDVIVETICDVRATARSYKWEKDETKKEEISKKLAEDVLPKFTVYIEKILKESGGEYLVGKELTWADIALFDIIEQVNSMWKEGILDLSEAMKNHYERIKALPKVKKWLETRPKSDL